MSCLVSVNLRSPGQVVEGDDAWMESMGYGTGPPDIAAEVSR